jgi:glutaminyl-tRNA synthetase
MAQPHPRQYEFARLNLTYVLTSKRKLKQLVDEGHVSGWDDPRMPTIVGLRRRGYTPESIQLFAERIGVTKSDSWIDYSTLEGCLRDDLDPKAPAPWPCWTR